MSYNKSILAFDDVREVFEQALASPKGIRITCENRAAATILRSRFNYYRKMDRSENGRTYPTEHPMWNKSSYDKLVLRIPAKGSPEERVLFIEPRSASNLTVEEII